MAIVCRDTRIWWNVYWRHEHCWGLKARIHTCVSLNYNKAHTHNECDDNIEFDHFAIVALYFVVSLFIIYFPHSTNGKSFVTKGICCWSLHRMCTLTHTPLRLIAKRNNRLAEHRHSKAISFLIIFRKLYTHLMILFRKCYRFSLSLSLCLSFPTFLFGRLICRCWRKKCSGRATRKTYAFYYMICCLIESKDHCKMELNRRNV